MALACKAACRIGVGSVGSVSSWMPSFWAPSALPSDTLFGVAPFLRWLRADVNLRLHTLRSLPHFFHTHRHTALTLRWRCTHVNFLPTSCLPSHTFSRTPSHCPPPQEALDLRQPPMLHLASLPHLCLFHTCSTHPFTLLSFTSRWLWTCVSASWTSMSATSAQTAGLSVTRAWVRTLCSRSEF